MHLPGLKKAVISAFMDDAYDGVVRLLCDAQRFGFVLETLSVERGDNGGSNVVVTFAVPAAMDGDVIVARLSRHLSIKGVVSQ